MKEQVEEALKKIRPMLQRDGGNVELIDVEDGIVKVRLQGACQGCPGAQMTLKHGIEQALSHALGPERSGHLISLLTGPHGNELIQVAHTLDVFSRYGIIFLLFMVGLRTSVEEMRQVGPDSLRVALIGVLLPFALGFASSYLLIPEITFHTSLFLGAALGATSVGISVMVLQELNLENTRVAHIILGAAVLDDILGLLLLAIVSGVVVTGGIEVLQILMFIVLSSGSLSGAYWCAIPFPRRRGLVVSSIKPIEAFQGRSRSISSWLSTPAFVWGSRPLSKASRQAASRYSAVLR